MAEATIQHELECGETTFWNELMFAESFNRRLFLERLRFPEFEVKKHEDTSTELRRVTRVVPRVGDLPGPLKKLIGDGIAYEEQGVFNKQRQLYEATVVPSELANKVQVRVAIRTEPLGNDRCQRIVDAKVTAKVFGVGGILERRILDDLRRSYDAAAEFTNRYLAGD